MWRRGLVVVVVVVVPLLQLLPPHLVGGELVAGELMEDSVGAGEHIAGWCCYCGCFCRGCCYCRGGGWWWSWYVCCNCYHYF